MLLSDRDIRGLCTKRPFLPDSNNTMVFGYYADSDSIGRPYREKPMIEPFSESVSGNDIVSYGLTSAGYDLSLAEEVMMFKNTSGQPVRACRFKDPEYIKAMFDTVPVYSDANGRKYVRLPPGSYVLGRSVEYLRIPRFLKGRCVGKSTLARTGIIINTTPAEPEWDGYLTIEISNPTLNVIELGVGEGIAQMEFELLSSNPEISYADKKGIYQSQVGVTPARTRE